MKNVKERIKKSKAVSFIAKLALITVLVAVCFNLLNSTTIRPHTTKEFSSTSVMITNMAKNSGGSGVILESHPTESIILTNRHVCGVIEEGGYVIQEDRAYLIISYKKANSHDLCEVKIGSDLGINTVVAEHAPEKYSDAFVSGHPSLYPHVLTKGAFSGRMTINVTIGLEECTKDNIKDEDDLMQCLFLGGRPITKAFDSQLVSATILPGSSGSAVFDSKGEIAGLVFASASRELAYALIVPQEYVKHFVDEEAASIGWTVPAKKQKPAQQAPEEEHTSVITPRKFKLYA